MWRSGKMMINDDHLWKFWGRSKQLNSVSSFHLSSNTRPFSSSVAIFAPWVLETRVLPRRSEPPSFGFRGRAVLTVRSGDVWGPGRSCAPWTLSPLFSGVKHGWEVPSPGEIAIFTCKILGKYGEKPLEMKVYSRNIIFGDFPASHVSLPEGSHQQLSRQATYLELWCHTTPSAGMDHPPSSFHLSSHPWWGVCSFSNSHDSPGKGDRNWTGLSQGHKKPGDTIQTHARVQFWIQKFPFSNDNLVSSKFCPSVCATVWELHVFHVAFDELFGSGSVLTTR